MKKEYLPSKEFTVRLIAIAIIIAIGFGIYGIVILVKKFVFNRSGTKTETPLVIKDIVQKDSNGNGIADWEESLWGLDPTQNGPSNKAYILGRQQALAKTGEVTESGTSPENELLAKQFFATIMSLEQSGNLDEASLQAVVDSIGSQVQAKPIPDIYTNAMFKTVPATQTSVITYLKEVSKLSIKYKDKNIGDELSFIATALKNNDEGAIKATADVARAYQSFGKELVLIPVPDAVLPLALTLANDYEKTGQSIEGLTQILTDPLIGMQALINYRKYNENLVTNLDILSDF